LINIDEDIKMSETDKDSFMNISEFINEEDNLETEMKEKYEKYYEEQDKESNNNNKNNYDYIVRIKENNMLKRENEELKNQINGLLEAQNDLKGQLIISPSL